MALGVGLVLLVALAAGVALGRASTPSAQAPAQPRGDGPGPARVVHGVPVGYAHDQAGAVAAAANYAAVLGDRANLDPGFGRRAYPVFALPDVVEDLRRRSERFTAGAAGVGTPGAASGVVLRGAPLGYRLEEYRGDDAVVSVWLVVVGVGTAELPMATSWGIQRLSLRWVEQDWKVAAVEGESGPTPPAGPGEPVPADLTARMNGFEPFVYLPGAAP